MVAYAKRRSGPADDRPILLPLVDHSADVAAVFAAVVRLPTIRRRLSRLAGRDLDERDLDRLTVLVALHDLGKVNHGFQRRILELPGRQAGHIGPLLALLDNGPATGGGASAQRSVLLARLLPEAELATLCEWCPDEGDGLMAALEAVLAHHGSLPAAPQFDPKLWQPAGGYDPVAEGRALIEAARAWLPDAFGPVARPLPAGGRFLHAVAGLVVLADRIGSDETWFGYPDAELGTGPDRFERARRRAARVLGERTFDVAAARVAAAALDARFEALFGGREPRPAQAALAALEEVPIDGPERVVVLEAETGSGKTEAALQHFLALFRAGVVDGMYFALPTRAAAVQIHGRVTEAVRSWLGDAAPAVLLGVPGYLRADDAEGERLGAFSVAWPDDEDGRLRERAWAVERASQYLAGTIVVGTVDQLLMAGIDVRHADFRAAAMLRLLLVVDEVHASDPYMERLLVHALDQHRHAGGHALLMSATLGAAMRQRLITGEADAARALPDDPAALAAEPYPAIHVSHGTAPAVAADPDRGKTVRVELRADPDDHAATAALALDAAAAGARVLVIRNRVADACALQRAVEEIADETGRSHLPFRCGEPPVPAPHHARYAAEDRLLLDEALTGRFGIGGADGGCVAVTTQTAEQSLDLDADLMITDLAPGDVLLQRLGRLHRHARPRPPGFETARAIVLAPPVERLTGLIDPSMGEARRGSLAGLGTVYPDLLSIAATREWLAEHQNLRVPEDNRALVETATHPPGLYALGERLGGPWAKHYDAVRGGSSA